MIRRLHKKRASTKHHYAIGVFIGLALIILAGVLSILSVHPISDVDTPTILHLTKISPSDSRQSLLSTIVTKQPVVKSAATTTKSAGLFNSSASWSQNFSSMPNGQLSSNVWSYDIGNGGPDNPGWGNNEDEYYTNSLDNVRVQNGELIIEAQKQSEDGFNYTSARIKTTPSLDFTYGKLDIVAELPSGVGTWPAFWMLSTNNNYAVWNSTTEQDPNNYLHDGEIDIMEATGSIAGQITSSAQSYIYNPSNNNERFAEKNIANDTTAFHEYEFQWTPTSLEFLVDGVVYHTVTKSPGDSTDVWPYNQPYYLILNIAMGGSEGGTESQLYPPYGINDASGPWEMAIKSINYYPYTGN